MHDYVICLGVAFAVFSSAALASDAPVFSDYPVKEIRTEKIRAVDLNSHPKAKIFKTRLNAVVGKTTNFAGHYVVVTWGCGASCQTVALVDVKSGKVFFAPFSTGLGSEFRIDSSLFIDSPPQAIRDYYGGKLDVSNRLFYSSYYEWEEKTTKFRLVYGEAPQKR